MPSGEGSNAVADAFAAAGPLLPVLSYEIGRGNTVDAVSDGKIQLTKPLDLENIKTKLSACLKGLTIDDETGSVVAAGGITLLADGTNPYSKGAAFVNGEFVPMASAKISVTDYGYRRSDVTYDVVSVANGQFFRLDDHIARFRRSMNALRMKPKETDDEIKAILHKLLQLTKFDMAYVAMDCLRGIPSPGAPRNPAYAVPHIVAYAVPFVWVVPKEISFGRGAHIIVSKTPRIPDACIDQTVKNFHWGDLTSAAFEANDAGADTAILVDYEGKYLTEGPGFNLYLIIDGTFVTPQRGCLMGVTRQSMLDLCAELGIPTEVRNVAKEELDIADEVGIMTTAGGVMPVSRVNGKPVKGRDEPGPLSCKIRDLFWEKRKEGWKGDKIDY